MKCLVQRAKFGAVDIAGERVAVIGPGAVILVGARVGDTPAQADWLAEKVAHLRIFEDDAGKLNRSILESGGSALVVSQFTLYADSQKGRRPSFTDAAPPDQAEPLITRFTEQLQRHGVPVQTGRFRAEMLVTIHNDGPVTIILER